MCWLNPWSELQKQQPAIAPTWPYGSPVGPSCSARLPYVTMTCSRTDMGEWSQTHAARLRVAQGCLDLQPNHQQAHAYNTSRLTVETFWNYKVTG